MLLIRDKNFRDYMHALLHIIEKIDRIFQESPSNENLYFIFWFQIKINFKSEPNP
jgi:hypothetical protein